MLAISIKTQPGVGLGDVSPTWRGCVLAAHDDLIASAVLLSPAASLSSPNV